MRINIVDAIPGAGKTAAAINYINNADPDTRFLYITPYLKEAKRIIASCKGKHFVEPECYGTKLEGIKYLFEKGANIVSTHALFRHFDQEIIDLAFNNNYVLIMDEVADVIEPLNITDDDFSTIVEKYASIDKDGILRWYATEYRGEFEKYKRMCDLESIGVYAKKEALWLFPIAVFQAFREIFILTYMFEAQIQKYYFDYYGVKYRQLYVAGDSTATYRFSEDRVQYQMPDYSSLIHVFENEKLNEIGKPDNALSKRWYKRNKK